MKQRAMAKRDDDLRPEYEFDYRGAQPNRFAADLKKGGRMIVLEPEVAEVFRTSRDVNAVPRALPQNMSGPRDQPKEIP